MDFNGMVRHYYLRQESHLADIRINLVDKGERAQQSHEFALRLRADLEEIARQVGADLKIVEVPPGPPVIATLVVEVYGDEETTHDELLAAAGRVRERMAQEPGVRRPGACGSAWRRSPGSRIWTSSPRRPGRS
jgi:hypothetical protein